VGHRSNGYRIGAWKFELAKFAADTGVHVTVCHLPPGTSKWNEIEHRLFSQITMNRRGQPLKTHQGHRRPDAPSRVATTAGRLRTVRIVFS